MLRLSCNLLALVILLTLVSFVSFWPLNFIRFGRSFENNSGFILGASTQKNLALDIKHYPWLDKITVTVLALRSQKTVYHNISTVRNTSARPRVFSIANSVLSGDFAPVDDFEVYFMAGSRKMTEITLNPNEEATLNVEFIGKEAGPSSFETTLLFDIRSF